MFNIYVYKCIKKYDLSNKPYCLQLSFEISCNAIIVSYRLLFFHQRVFYSTRNFTTTRAVIKYKRGLVDCLPLIKHKQSWNIW